MAKKLLTVLLLLVHVVYADFEYKINNSNFTISQGSIFPNEDETYIYNYNRLRFRGDYTDNGFFSTVITDGVNYFGNEFIDSNTFEYIKHIKSDTPYKTKTNDGSLHAKVYRLYGGYEDNKNRLVIGLQNISMGVGRIWTPTNLFNPKNSYALEPDEVFGVAALSYTRHISDTSHVSIVLSQKEDDSFKYLARYKAFLGFGDVAVNLISSKETKMIGYEIEANLGDTGVEVRSEGAYLKNKLLHVDLKERDEEFFQGIVGADYGFESGVTIVVEALYSSEKFSYEEILLNIESEALSNLLYSNFYMGTSLSYSFTLFLDGSFSFIESFNDKNSRFIAPSLTYTLNDFNSFKVGALIQNGANNSEFGMNPNSYYFNYSFSF
ncbi:hypothetical protein HUE87_03215 [Candidatus Sulfurimonas marisnigri]|uniref:Alginate export domain-containing protein n=1 Tax=Candidatus Sulfurimonas marisnigri TaxID=2740405 RepID=A0A7S7RR29_9BACT|nr:hypothetical protein [Candidatus Sulfurimonas marisnigri]QOY55259.1 hypothetical protein HUE87_03215 [Candidatus Sulfurimonas marisnigri]